MATVSTVVRLQVTAVLVRLLFLSWTWLETESLQLPFWMIPMQLQDDARRRAQMVMLNVGLSCHCGCRWCCLLTVRRQSQRSPLSMASLSLYSQTFRGHVAQAKKRNRVARA